MDLESATNRGNVNPTRSRLGDGSKLGPHQIEVLLGAGGMGQVYRAFDTRLHRTIAIKVLAREKFHDPEHKLRFFRRRALRLR